MEIKPIGILLWFVLNNKEFCRVTLRVCVFSSIIVLSTLHTMNYKLTYTIAR
jgi:hypothetical protein